MCAQINSAVSDQAGNVRGGKWLLANPRTERAQKNPTHARYNGSHGKPRSVQQNKSNEHEKNTEKKAASKIKMRSGEPRNRATQAESDAASKSRGDRQGRKLHGA